MGHYPLEPFRTRFEKISTDILPIGVPSFFLLSLTGMFQLPWSRTVEEKTTPNNLGWPV